MPLTSIDQFRCIHEAFIFPFWTARIKCASVVGILVILITKRLPVFSCSTFSGDGNTLKQQSSVGV